MFTISPKNCDDLFMFCHTRSIQHEAQIWIKHEAVHLFCDILENVLPLIFHNSHDFIILLSVHSHFVFFHHPFSILHFVTFLSMIKMTYFHNSNSFIVYFSIHLSFMFLYYLFFQVCFISY